MIICSIFLCVLLVHLIIIMNRTLSCPAPEIPEEATTMGGARAGATNILLLFLSWWAGGVESILSYTCRWPEYRLFLYIVTIS